VDGYPHGVSGRPIERTRLPFGLEVVVLVPADWTRLRAIRLRALRDSPHAFASSYEREASWSEREWRGTFDAASWFVAQYGPHSLGLARSARAVRPWQRHVESVWVAPAYRRRGIVRILIENLIHHESKFGATELLMWVLDGNDTARHVYERLGFRLTGEHQPLPGSVARTEQRLARRIRPALA
jgi:ribosomal protein S18 acetylase RimI-like enzyme